MLLTLMSTHFSQFRFADTVQYWYPSWLITLTSFRTDNKHVPLVLQFAFILVFPTFMIEGLEGMGIEDVCFVIHVGHEVMAPASCREHDVCCVSSRSRCYTVPTQILQVFPGLEVEGLSRSELYRLRVVRNSPLGIAGEVAETSSNTWCAL